MEVFKMITCREQVHLCGMTAKYIKACLREVNFMDSAQYTTQAIKWLRADGQTITMLNCIKYTTKAIAA